MLLAIGPLIVTLALGASPQDAAPVPAPKPANDAALNRIRERLRTAPAAPLRVTLPEPEPTFRVHIQEHPYFTEQPTTWDFGGGGVPFTAPGAGAGSQPLASVDLLAVGRGIKKAIAKREAAEEVRRAMEEFCATHRCDQ